MMNFDTTTAQIKASEAKTQSASSRFCRWKGLFGAAWGSAVFSLIVHGAQAQDSGKWPVQNAVVRFQFEIELKPNDPSAGVFAILPDAGTLPQPFPEAIVLDSAGKELKNECVWHNPREGMGIVFEQPKAAGPLWVYIRSATEMKNVWTEKSAFRPGLFLYTQTAHSSLPEARSIASEVPSGKGARLGQVPMIADRQNRFGPSDTFVSYYTGYLNITKEGAYRFGTVSSDGSTALLDGQVVSDWPGRHPYSGGEKGEKMGRPVTLSKGPHRVQYFHFSVSAKPQAQLVWRYPGLGKEMPETPMGSNWIQSGSVKMINAETRNGSPLSVFEKTAVSYLGFNEQWIDLYELSVPFADQYKNATYSWKFSDGSDAQGPKVYWVAARSTDMPRASLSITTTRGTSIYSRLLYPDMIPESAKVDNVEDRQQYQEALLNRLKGTHGNRPAKDWSKGIWGLLPEVIEPREAKEVLKELFERSVEDLANLPPGARAKLENIYYDELHGDKSGTAVLRQMTEREKDPVRRLHWQFKQVDYQLYEIGDIKAARALASQITMNRLQVTPEEVALQQIQLGDIERLDGNLEKAQQIYGQAQMDYQRVRHEAEHPLGSVMEHSGVALKPGAKEAPKEAQKEAPKKAFVIGAASGSGADWRKRTVQETTYFTQVKNLLSQDYLAEARETLDKWQIEFPLGKLAGDFPVAEASYFAALENYERAVRILRAYRKQVDISKDLPDAMQLEWDCLAKLQKLEPLKELAADVKKRFPDLPLAKRADDVLAGNLPPQPDEIIPKAVKGKKKSHRFNQ